MSKIILDIETELTSLKTTMAKTVMENYDKQFVVIFDSDEPRLGESFVALDKQKPNPSWQERRAQSQKAKAILLEKMRKRR